MRKESRPTPTFKESKREGKPIKNTEKKQSEKKEESPENINGQNPREDALGQEREATEKSGKYQQNQPVEVMVEKSSSLGEPSNIVEHSSRRPETSRGSGIACRRSEMLMEEGRLD